MIDWGRYLRDTNEIALRSLRQGVTYMSKENPTHGEKLVRINFNPAGDHLTDQIKQMTAELIDICEANKDKDARLASLAITTFESAAMWAVKLATTK